MYQYFTTMKALILSSVVICLSGCLFGQNENPIKKGNFIVGGSLSFDKNNHSISVPNGYVKSSSLMTDINLNYLIFDHISVGLTLESLISSSKERHYQNSEYIKYIRNDFFIGPAIRWYLISGLYLSSSAEFGGYHYWLKDSPIKWRKFLFSTGIGYTASVGKSLAIEPALRYYYQHSKAVRSATGFEKYNGLQLSVGVQILFNFRKQITKPKENEKV